MATLKFYANEANEIPTGSGLGFYGAAGFGSSVSVGSYQGTTFVTNSAGTVRGPQADNVTFMNAGSGKYTSSHSGIGIDAIPNNRATLNIRFTHTSAVKAQNAQLRIYDRSNINNAASGVTTKVAEITHPWATESPHTAGSGVNDGIWYTPAGSGTVFNLSPSPGQEGKWAGDGASARPDDRHDWYVAMSASPNSIGSKSQYGLYVTLEYL